MSNLIKVNKYLLHKQKNGAYEESGADELIRENILLEKHYVEAQNKIKGITRISYKVVKTPRKPKTETQE